MKQIQLEIPVIVQHLSVNDKMDYHLRPLFFNYPTASNRLFDRAVNQFQKEVKHYFKGFTLNRDNLDQLLWYLFNPSIKYQLLSYSNTIGKQYIQGQVAVASFNYKNQTFIALPAFNYYMFIAQKEETGKVNIQQQAVKAITHLLRLYKKEYGRELDPTPYFSGKREFLTHISVNVSISYDGFKFERESDQWFYNRLKQSDEFEGAAEIEKVGYDLNSLYPNELERAYYQEDLVKRLYDSIYNHNNTPIVLIGKTGSGKRTLIDEIVWRFLADFYKTFSKKAHRSRIWNVDPTRVIAGMSIVGMWQKRLESIIKYIRAPHLLYKQSDKLLIDNVVALLRIGKSAQNNMTMADVLKPYIEKRQLQVILLATPEEWKILQEKDRSFGDLFQVIRIQEPDIATATKIVLKKRQKYEADNACEITIKAIEQLLTIQRNYFKQQALPGSILKLLQQLSAKYRFGIIDAPEVRAEFEDFSGLNERIFTNISFDINEVKDSIARQLVGQDEAVEALANTIHTIKAKLSDPSKPNGSFMFIGPTGVGKTQAAKVLCQYLTGNENQLMRFDMNEYIDESAVQRLIGNYYNPEGILTGKVRYRPFGVVLFDEIEKAHPKVHDILLQVLDDGRLTDSLGRTVDFTNTIVIMTSNIGARKVASQLGFDTSTSNDKAIYRKAAENYFRPEFINRIDRIVIFNPLKITHILNIARLQIKELLQRDGFVRRTTILNISTDALEWVARRGFDARMGGRALKRQIERDLTSLSAEQLISSYSKNPIILEISFEDNQLMPKIQELDFVAPIDQSWLPQLPDETKGKGFFGHLLRELEQIESAIKAEDGPIVFGSDTDKTVNWQYYQFKDGISRVKQKIQTLMLGFRDRYFKDGPAIPLRFKSSPISWSEKGARANLKDRLFQKAAIAELATTYQYGAIKFNSLQTEFIDCFLDVSIIKQAQNAFLNDELDTIQIYFESCINGLGNTEIQFLLTHYERIFEQLEIPYTVYKEALYIEAQSYALYDLFQGEVGIHLFYKSHQNPLPIKISIMRNGANTPSPTNPYRVIRLYDSLTTITDLRTGFSNTAHMRVDEFKLLLFSSAKK